MRRHNFYAVLAALVGISSGTAETAMKPSPAAQVSDWVLKLSDSQPSGAISAELTALRGKDNGDAARMITQVEGLEVWARELGDGSQVVGLFNREGRKPQLDLDAAAYRSPVVTRNTPGGLVEIDVRVQGAKKLYLAVDDAGDGNSGDHADWIEPRLVGPSGEKRLTDFEWVSASTGWGQVSKEKSAGGQALQVGNEPATYGIGTHADSVIEYDLPSGVRSFKASIGVDQTGGPRGSVRFSVFTENPWKRSTAPETIAVNLHDLGYAIPCEVRNVGSHSDLGVLPETLSAEVPLGGAALFVVTPTPVKPRTEIRSGEIWGDTDGRVIQVHGGGMMFHEGVYYWYGENKNGKTTSSGVARVDVVGVSCYSSTDLLNWKNEGMVLKAVNEPGHDLHPSRVVERPKVIYNAKTKKFVMWAHIDSADYGYARGGCAIADSPSGPFEYLGSVRPHGQMCRDQTLFVDDDGTAYHIFSSEGNATTYISKLSDDYTKHTDTFIRVFVDKFLEAPAIFKRGENYYMIASGQSGWAPNPAHSCISDSMLGDWKEIGDPCHGPKANTTYDSQSTHVINVQGKKDAYIFMADRWKPSNLRDSRYVWLPLRFEGDQPKIDWQDAWSPTEL